jgi:TonB family protein
MYDDLARTQRTSLLEQLTLNMVIPSVLLTLAIAPPEMNARQVVPRFYGESWPVMLGTVGSDVRPRSRAGMPDAPASLRWMPLPRYPAAMLEARQEGHIVVKARVDTDGRVRWESSVVLQAAHAEFVTPVRNALQNAEFRPASAAGVPVECWVIVSVYFDIYVE